MFLTLWTFQSQTKIKIRAAYTNIHKYTINIQAQALRLQFFCLHHYAQ